MKKEYNPWLSIGRGIAAVLVVMLHTSPLACFGDTANFILSSVITRWAVPYFFLLSGYLYTFNRTIQKKYLGRYISRLAISYAFWIVVYSPHKILYIIKHFGEMQPKYWVKGTLLDIVYNGFYQHMWFIPALVVSIIMLEVTFQIGEKWRHLLACLLYVLGAIGGMYGNALSVGAWVNSIFITTRNGLFFGFPMLVLGSYIHNNKERLQKCNQYILVIGAIGFVIINTVEVSWASMYKTAIEYSYGLTTFVFPLMALLIMISLYTNSNNEKVMNAGLLCDRYSMGGYYLHPLVLIVISDIFNYSGIESSTPFLFFSVLVFTIIGVFVMKKIFRNTIFRNCV